MMYMVLEHSKGMLATEDLAADKESRILGGLLATMECRNSTISGSTDHSTAKRMRA